MSRDILPLSPSNFLLWLSAFVHVLFFCFFFFCMFNIPDEEEKQCVDLKVKFKILVLVDLEAPVVNSGNIYSNTILKRMVSVF